jgi:methyl-accepting chemotaxis protein
MPPGTAEVSLLATPIAQAIATILQYGLLGALLLIAAVIIKQQRKEYIDLVAQVREMVQGYATLSEKVSSALDRMADATDERNRATDRLSEAVNRQADATKASASLVEEQNKRIMDRFEGISTRSIAQEQVIASLSESVRNVALRAERERR